MLDQLQYSHIPIGIGAGKYQVASGQMVPIFFVETITALKPLNGEFRSISLMGQRVRSNLNSLRFIHQRAAQFVDDQVRAVRVGLSMFSLLNSQGIASILYQSILKTASGAQKRPSIFAAVLNGLQRTVLTFIGAARRPPESVKSF